MKVLAIGNSFSQDATRYLHAIAKADGAELEVVNLYIGGCSLERHYRNMLGDKKDYSLEYNGQSTGFYVTMKEALLSRPWDIVTLQQVSSQSYQPDSYEPYLQALADFVRQCSPKAKLFIHQTWAYEQGSDRLHGSGYTDPCAMLKDIRYAYGKACKSIGADGLIRSGELLEALLKNGIAAVHRDTFHASKGLGRYALGLLWYRTLCGKDVSGNTFLDFDEPISQEEIKIAKESVTSL